MAKLSVRDLDVRGKRVLVRVDFNVPTEERDGKIRITDDTRIRESLPTINYLREHGAKTILMSHFGRPKGKPVDEIFAAAGGRILAFADRSSGHFQSRHHRRGAEENHRPHGERRCRVARECSVSTRGGSERSEFAEALAKLGDLYVNDAFGAAHRAHASTAGITKFVQKSAMGLLMEKELKYLRDGLEDPAKPFVVILGGAKVSDKIGVIKALMEKAEHDSDRRRHGEHVFESARNSGRREPRRSGQARSRARAFGSGEATRREISHAGRCGRGR